MAFPGFYCASRLTALLLFGVVQIQDLVFPQKNMTLNDTMRYQNGEIWWFEVRDDSHVLQDKIDRCSLISQHSDSFRTKALCMVQRNKIKAKLILTEITKSILCFTANILSNLTDSITTPLGLFVTIQLLVAIIGLTNKVPFLKRNHYINAIKSKISGLFNFIPDYNRNNKKRRPAPGGQGLTAGTGQPLETTNLPGSLVSMPDDGAAGLDPEEMITDGDEDLDSMMASQSLEGLKKKRVAFRDDLVQPGNRCDDDMTMMRSKAVRQVTSAGFKVRAKVAKSYPDVKGHSRPIPTLGIRISE